MSWPWNELGLPGPAGLPEIRRAYAQRLKTTHPEEDPEGFQRLHAAYQEASRWARLAARAAQPSPTAAPESPGEPVLSPEAEEERDSGEPPTGQQRPPAGKPEQSQAPDWDYDELLKERQPQEIPRQPEEAVRDGGKPLQQAEEPHSPDWDYERLFAEGEEEARAARRRKLEELRQKNRARYAAQERTQRRRAADEEESWAAVMAAAHALDLLHSTGAPLPQWRRFLNGPVFWNVRANLDFVFALEDFLEQHPDLSPEVRKAIFTAYGFQKGPGQPVYRRLYRLLHIDRREKRRMAKAGSRWRAVWQSYPTWRKTVIIICFSILAVFFLLGWAVNLRSAYRDFMARRASEAWEVQSLQWLEEDFGEPFLRPLGGHDEICAPASDPTLYFWVAQEGTRTETRPGYRTDYPHMLLKRRLEDFAEEWELGLDFDSAGGGYKGNLGEAPGAYLFDLPLEGAGEAITALGALLEEVKTQNWYRVLEDKYGGQIVYQILLCHGGLSFYDAVSNREPGFDADYARAQYETQVGPAFCRYVIEETGLAAKHLGEEGTYVLLDRGRAEIDGSRFFWVSGLDTAHYELQVHYFLAAGGRLLFCLPPGKLESIQRITDLYRGDPSHVQLDGVGLVMIWDQV